MAGTTRTLSPLAAVPSRLISAVPGMQQSQKTHRLPAIAAAAVGMLAGVAAEGRLWESHPLLTTVNLVTTSAFVVTGLLLLEDRDQRGTAWLLILAGISLPLGWSDQWEAGPLPLYSVVFGYLSDIFGAVALLRYPETRLLPAHRRFCTVLAQCRLP